MGVLGALGFLTSYTPEMGDARVSCDGGCACDGADEVETLSGWHSTHTSVTSVAWMSLRLTAPIEESEARGQCPCAVHVTARHRPGQAADAPIKFKLNLASLSHEGDMSWIDSWKVQNLAVGDSARRHMRRAR